MVTTTTQGGRDPDAIHDNTASEISAIAEKAAPVAADLVVIEDSEAANVKKRVQLGNIPAGGGDSTYTDTYANIPAASNDGDLFLPSDGISVYRDTGAAWAPWGPLFPMATPPTAGWSWVNQGGASVAAAGGGIYLLGPAGAGINIRARVRSVPSVPYTVTMWLMFHSTRGNNATAGALWRQSSDGKLATAMLYTNGTQPFWFVSKYTNPTTVSASYLSAEAYYTMPVCIKLEDDNTNRKVYWSQDGQNFHTLHSVGRTDFLTADQIGFYVDPENATWPTGITLLSWEEG